MFSKINQNVTTFLAVTAMMFLASLCMAQTEWVKYEGNPVLDLGEDGTWDDYTVGYPCVLFDGNEYKMWYVGNDGGSHYRIGYATSSDGINWEKYPNNPVLDLGESGTWDDYRVYYQTVLFDGNEYKMWYAGIGDLYHERIGYATSPDGINWEKHPDNPILDLGQSGTWDDSRCLKPCVLFDGSEYKMWYTGGDGSHYRIGYATSPDGIHWEKHTNNPVLDLGESGTWDDKRVVYPTVIFDGNYYKMWYAGYDGTHNRTGYATSPDGINWEKYTNNPVLDLGESGTWDDKGVVYPTVIFDGNYYKMWYAGYDGTHDRIGYATSSPLKPMQISDRVLWKEIDQGWFNSGTTVENGDIGIITVQGFSNSSPEGLGWQGWVGPGGYINDAGNDGIVEDAPLQSVIYKVSEAGTPHYLGTGGGKITFDADGELWFNINNNTPEDSDGAFLFTVALEGECSPDEQGLLGDVSGDNTISAFDASLILQYVVGIIDSFPVEEMSAAKLAVPAIYELQIPNATVKDDEIIRVPITINNSDSLATGGFTVQYDQSILRAVTIMPRNMLSGAYWKSQIDEESGEIRFAFAKTESNGKSDDASIALLEFEPIGNAEGITTGLILHDVQLAESISIKKVNGSITFLPKQSALLQNYPNPFNPDTWIPFQLAESADVTISIYDISGNLVRMLKLGEKHAGIYTTKERAVYWDGRNSSGEKVSTGLYFYTLEAGSYSATRRMLILK